MYKKISSVIVIIFTLLYVAIMFYISGYNIVEIGSTKARQVINTVKVATLDLVSNKGKEPKIVYEEVKQRSGVEPKNFINEPVKPSGKLYKLNIMKISDKGKEDKLEKVYISDKELRQSIGDKTPIDLNNTSKASNSSGSNDTSNTYKQSESNVAAPVFNPQPKYELTEEDKERIVTVSKKLSPLDQEKINTYLKYIDDSNARNAINLLKDRLTDKDFEKIKDLNTKLNKK